MILLCLARPRLPKWQGHHPPCTQPGPHSPDPYLVFLGSRGPLPCSFLTNISLLLRITSRIFPRELLRWRVPLPSWTQRHKPGRRLSGTDRALACCR